MPSSLAAAAVKASKQNQRHDNDNPLWAGPCGAGPLGGVTQSMLGRFLSCRERFRLKYVLGLEPHDKWNHRLGYGNMWHLCEEQHAKDTDWWQHLSLYVSGLMGQYPLQRDEISKWWRVCCVQFPEYVTYWQDHPDVQNRTPLMQEQVFDVPYSLPSGRVVRLRGKFDSVDLIDGGVWLQENKTKSDIDKMQIERQLSFDLQTMLYITAYKTYDENPSPCWKGYGPGGAYKMVGVRYNVIRRPLSGGKGSIRPHAAKATKYTMTPAETDEEFYERLRRDYIAAEPDYWFFRVRSEVSAKDIQVFRETCLDPILEQLCWWYDEVAGKDLTSSIHDYGYPPLNYRMPFGVYNALQDNGTTEYDVYLESGNETGLQRVEALFGELQ